MEKNRIVEVAELMSKRAIKRGRARVETEHVIKIPDNNCLLTNLKPIPKETYVARADDLVILAFVFSNGEITTAVCEVTIKEDNESNGIYMEIL